ncbi:MAG TPA: sialidase family protein [Acidimicrobiales bacterium]|nr:sialidase family protein [Acidimicrobiales bacterium]
MRRPVTVVAMAVATVLALVVAGQSWSDPPFHPTFVGGRMPDPTGRPSGEPGLAVAGDGTIWVAAIHGAVPPPQPDPTAIAVQGTGVWRSRDNGKSFTWVGDPLQVTARPGVFLGGSDADIAAAPLPNATGNYSVYVTSLGPPGGVNLAVSQDGGETFAIIPVGGLPVPPIDRPWIAADGACGFYVAYHGGPSWCANRFDVCDRLATATSALTSVEVAPGGASGVEALVGKVAVDTGARSRFTGNAYVPMEVCEFPLGPPGEEESGGCAVLPRIQVARTTDHGRTWQRVSVATVGNRAAPIWPATVAVDPTGTVHTVWFDDIQVYLSSSADGGATWSPARVISSGSASSAYPTVAAPAAGRVDVAWFGADRPGNANDRSVMGPAGATSSAAWKVWLARSTDGGRSFRRAVISDTVHFGELCTHGGGCENPGRTRTLFDDFGLGATRDGRSVVAFTTDQPGGTLESDRIAWLTERPGTK